MIAGRYQLGNLIGRGGMADVYEGVDRGLSRAFGMNHSGGEELPL